MAKRAVVFGAYGFIGAAAVRRLIKAGYDVVGVGRSDVLGQRLGGLVDWHRCDLASASVEDLRKVTADSEVVINASGALQDGAKDDLAAIHCGLIKRLIQALEGRTTRVVQISAAGASENASSAFLSTKGAGDQLLVQSNLDAIILRPTLVLGPQAYGGTALLRALAGFPVVGPKLFQDTEMQVIHVDELAEAIRCAAEGKGGRATYDLTSDEIVSFDTLATRVRQWQGFADWRWRLHVPVVALTVVGKCADAMGWLGWRSPMRSTALTVLRDGVSGDARPWAEATGQRFSGLDGCLAQMPATAQERSFARMYLFLPLTIGLLSLFWMLSGLLGFVNFDLAQSVLSERGLNKTISAIAVLGGAFVDLVLGAAILIRRFCRLASLGMGLTAIAYMLGAAVLAPDLWADPLGPMVKVLPAALLSLLPYWMLEER